MGTTQKITVTFSEPMNLCVDPRPGNLYRDRRLADPVPGTVTYDAVQQHRDVYSNRRKLRNRYHLYRHHLDGS